MIRVEQQQQQHDGIQHIAAHEGGGVRLGRGERGAKSPRLIPIVGVFLHGSSHVREYAAVFASGRIRSSSHARLFMSCAAEAEAVTRSETRG
ncbi:hypothetical protein Bsp3421_000654 (plasmid) [Burkholderia sp. FERM BP-3421]|nr:hypothetical protein [Burkholderia sp. FERM BP-3421]WDD90779.1 hypothetical protein Bsp3421_000654 [Burkholderia sp. FERM BP-3421]